MLALSSMVAIACGATGNVLMATGLVAADSSNGADTTSGAVQNANGGSDGGTMSVSQGQEIAGDGGDGLYTRDVDEVVLKINPMSTPLLQITSYASSSEIDSQEFEYWSVGPRVTRTVLTKDIAAAQSASADRFEIEVADKGFVTKDDTIRVVGIKGWKAGSNEAATTAGQSGATKTGGDGAEDLVLYVINVNDQTGNPIVAVVNGKKGLGFMCPVALTGSTTTSGGQTKDTPVEGQVLIRMGKSCGEMDAQTGRFHNYPEPEVQYTQNFMFQVEQSTFDKMTSKKVKWDFNDIEEAGIRDMKIAQENTYLFGAKRKVRHSSKENNNQYFTGGLWWMAGKDITIGHPSSTEYEADGATAKGVIQDDDLVTFAREVFVGSAGNKKKVMLCGSTMLERFGQIKSDRFRLKETVDVWDLTFSRFHTDFGDILVIYDEQLDMNGMSRYGFCIDPEYIKKKVFISLKRTVLELIKSGQRNSSAVVLQEVAGVYLQNADAHARVKLASTTGFDWDTAAKFDYYAAKTSTPQRNNGNTPLMSNYDGLKGNVNGKIVESKTVPSA